MAEEPTLPRLPSVSWNPETDSFNNTRKRARHQETASELFSNSSDPAVFSSDDDPHVDNYACGRHRKKRYVGSWFQQHLASTDSAFSEEVRTLPKPERTFERQFDSGVWMGSDSFTDMDEDLDLSPEPRLPQLKYPRAPIMSLSPTEEFARQRIQTAIDSGNEDIDLSSLGLESLSNETIARLSEFSCIPLVTEGVPFEQKEPALKLYLASNPLPRVPGAVFNLEYLTVLSLRNTQISELPPSIGNLRNLTTLNLSLNRLRCLPGELLDLLKFSGKLVNLNIHPNPFYQPDITSWPTEPDEKFQEEHGENTMTIYEELRPDGAVLKLWIDKEDQPNSDSAGAAQASKLHGKWQISVASRSPVEYSDSRGLVISKFHLPVQEADSPVSEHQPHGIQTEDLTSTPMPPQDRRIDSTSHGSRGRVLSLFELALQACARTGQLRELPSYLSLHAPPQFTKALDRIIAQSEDNANLGDVPCSVCKRRVVMPTAQWIEWWELSHIQTSPDGRVDPVGFTKQERLIPFLRRGCTWNCGPKPMKVGQFLPGTVRFGLEKPREDAPENV